uniref:Glucuronosyltransferase n=1 Tax=Rhabditophanes sp. KR3021 TaxID=114890 RepID=A0AC35U3K4_9BILA
MFDQMVMIGLQMGVLDLPFPYELEIAKEKFSNGTFKTLDELRVVSQETINRIGNELFKKSCISRNSLINSLDSAGNITDIMRAILDRTDIKAERMDTIHIKYIFVTHGGLNSIHESAHAGVKLLVTPLFGDQKHNAKIVSEKVKIGITLTKEDVGVPEKLFDGLTKLMEEDSKISRNSFRLKEMIKNRPYNNKEVFIKTIDFAAKFEKLNLNMEEQDMPLYKYLLLDIILIIVLFPFVVIGLLYLLF